MNIEPLLGELDHLVTQIGIPSCALVDAETGMILLARGDAVLSPSVWEAAADYWRLHARHRSLFTELGALRAVVMYHAAGLLVVYPCSNEPTLLLVAHGPQKNVDWRAWQQGALRIGQLIRNKP